MAGTGEAHRAISRQYRFAGPGVGSTPQNLSGGGDLVSGWRFNLDPRTLVHVRLTPGAAPAIQATKSGGPHHPIASFSQSTPPGAFSSVQGPDNLRRALRVLPQAGSCTSPACA